MRKRIIEKLKVGCFLLLIVSAYFGIKQVSASSLDEKVKKEVERQMKKNPHRKCYDIAIASSAMLSVPMASLGAKLTTTSGGNPVVATTFAFATMLYGGTGFYISYDYCMNKVKR